MLTKESTLKELVSEITVNWFKTIVNERIKKLRVEIDELTKQVPMLLQMGGASNLEFETSINQIQTEVSVLKNLNDIEMYTKKNSFDANQAIFKDGDLSFESMAQFLQKGESISQMLIKLQLGETFAITHQILEKINILDLKIGYEETLKAVEWEDLDYLLNKSLNPWEQEILNFIAHNATDADNVLGEIRQLINTKDWETKLKNAEIIERYFSKFKASSLFGNLTNPEDLQDKSNQEQIINYSRVMGKINSLIFLIKLNQTLLKEFKKITG